RVVPEVLEDADDREPWHGIALPGLEALAERVIARPETLGHRLVDESDARGGDRVAQRELPAGDERNAEGPQDVRARDAVAGALPLPRTWIGVAFGGHAAARAAAAQRQMADSADG